MSTDAAPTITEFLLARITEDEAESALMGGLPYYDGGWSLEHEEHIRAECAAKRAIIEHCRTLEAKVFNDDLWNVDEHDDILEALAAVYSDHPDYQQEWAL